MIFQGSPQHLEIDSPIGQTYMDYLVLQLDSTCPASTKTRGLLGNVKDTSLKELNERIQRALREILGKNLPKCLVRSPEYRKLVAGLSNTT